MSHDHKRKQRTQGPREREREKTKEKVTFILLFVTHSLQVSASLMHLLCPLSLSLSLFWLPLSPLTREQGKSKASNNRQLERQMSVVHSTLSNSSSSSTSRVLASGNVSIPNGRVVFTPYFNYSLVTCAPRASEFNHWTRVN